METLTKCYRKRDSKQRIGFLHREKPKPANDEDDEELDSAHDSDSYYGDSDKSDSDDDNVGKNKGKGNGKAKASDKEDDGKIKPDWKLIRLIFRTMVNLVQCSTLQIFPIAHRNQLLTFLNELRIGESEGEEKSLSMSDLVRKDRIVDVYFGILEEQTAGIDPSLLSALKPPVLPDDW